MSNDDVASMHLAVNHLVQLGHTEIGLALGPERYTPVIRKVQGFRAAMREHLGIEPAHLERLVTHTVFSLEGGAAAAGRLVSTRRHRGDLRVGPDGPGRHPAGAIDGPAGAARRLGGRLRRLAR